MFPLALGSYLIRCDRQDQRHLASLIDHGNRFMYISTSDRSRVGTGGIVGGFVGGVILGIAGAAGIAMLFRRRRAVDRTGMLGNPGLSSAVATPAEHEPWDDESKRLTSSAGTSTQVCE